jgi:hypothetical protein
MYKKIMINFCLITAVAFAAAVCSPSGDEPAQVDMEVVANCSGITDVTTDLGWKVKVTAFDVAITNMEFTIEGDVHEASLIKKVSDFIIPQAVAHPGHLAGGEVTGELNGAWSVDFMKCDDSKPLGTATLLEGDYHGFNFYFTRSDAPADTPVSGHTAYIAGSAEKDGVSVVFEAYIDIEDGEHLVGGVFEDANGGGASNFVVTEDTDATLGLRLLTLDPYEGDTVFDSIDFGALKLNDKDVAVIKEGDTAFNIIAKNLYSHDQWAVEAVLNN